ncbi:MAG: AraC family transcriptional regulator [Bryobacteraceae bacterium]|nr:AraC family transcriptional regulator [Bryobacteraceae bacterium]
MAKIAVGPGHRAPVASPLAAGPGWSISDVVCSAGPLDAPFEEQHAVTSIALVVSGTFQYCSSTGSDLMTPGSLLLGNAGACFRCRHEHGTGDRCVAFFFEPGRWEQLGLAAPAARPLFQVPRLPPSRFFAPEVAKVIGLQAGDPRLDAEEIGVQLAAKAIQLARDVSPERAAPALPSALARVSRVVRLIDHEPGAPHRLLTLAAAAKLSPYHFLRTFEALTGTTPHQYLMRTRLRRAALRLRTETSKILDIALDCGFGDLSNFNRAVRAEFGVAPRIYRSLG